MILIWFAFYHSWFGIFLMVNLYRRAVTMFKQNMQLSTYLRLFPFLVSQCIKSLIFRINHLGCNGSHAGCELETHWGGFENTTAYDLTPGDSGWVNLKWEGIWDSKLKRHLWLSC